jgi:hypothetical protein
MNMTFYSNQIGYCVLRYCHMVYLNCSKGAIWAAGIPLQQRVSLYVPGGTGSQAARPLLQEQEAWGKSVSVLGGFCKATSAGA